MGSVYKRGKRWYIQFKDHDGQWVTRSAASTKLEAGQILKEVERALRGEQMSAQPESTAANVSSTNTPQTPQSLPLKESSEAWLERRKLRKLRNWANDRTHFVHHILPVLGEMPVGEIRVRHIRELVERLQLGDLAPRTVLKIYGTLHKFFADQVVDELIQISPCVLTKDQLPRSRDKDPQWRATAVFTREEVELLISSPLLPEDRQVLYTLLFLGGSRFGEVAALRWGDLELFMSPLSRLLIHRSYDHGTKTETPRQVPVHPVLSECLASWRRGGFVELMGRSPQPTDLIIPSRMGVMRSRHHTRNKFLEDIARLGLRHRRVHDSRRTLITLARVDGARKDVLEHITHGARGNILDMYTTLPWPTLCEAIMCLKMRRLSVDECTHRMAELLRMSDIQNGQPISGQKSEFTAHLTAETENRLTDPVQAPNPSDDSPKKQKWRRRELNVTEAIVKQGKSAQIGVLPLEQDPARRGLSRFRGVSLLQP